MRILIGFTFLLASQASSPAQSFSLPLEPIAQFQQASALSVTSLDEIFVLDGGLSKLYKLDRNGKVVLSVGGFGTERDAFDTPLDITADGINVFIADRGNQRIVQYDRFLNFVTLLQNRPTSIDPFTSDGRFSSLSTQLWRPISVSVSAQGDLYILEETQRQVIRINPLTFAAQQQQRQNPMQFEFGGFNAGKGNLAEPYRLTTSRTGKVFVSDGNLRSVMVYDLFGNFVTELGKGVFSAPRGLACGQVETTLSGVKQLQEWLLVVDSDHVFIFDADQQTGFRVVGKISSEELHRLLGESFSGLIDLALTSERLFVLTPKSLHTIPLALIRFAE